MVRDDSHSEVSATQPVSRRTFVRGSLLLFGAGLGSSLLAACGGQQPAPTAVPPKPTEAAKPAAPPAQPAQPAPAAPAQPAVQPAAQAPGGAKTKNVSIRFNWTIKGEFTPFFVAQEKGFYKDAGLQVELGEGKSGTQAVQVVGSNND